MESEPERKKAQQEAQKAKLERLERKLGIAPGGKGKEKEDTSAGVKRRFDDTEYIEQSREIVDTVKSAVVAGLCFFPSPFLRRKEVNSRVASFRIIEEKEESKDFTIS